MRLKVHSYGSQTLQTLEILGVMSGLYLQSPEISRGVCVVLGRNNYSSERWKRSGLDLAPVLDRSSPGFFCTQSHGAGPVVQLSHFVCNVVTCRWKALHFSSECISTPNGFPKCTLFASRFFTNWSLVMPLRRSAICNLVRKVRYCSGERVFLGAMLVRGCWEIF